MAFAVLQCRESLWLNQKHTPTDKGRVVYVFFTERSVLGVGQTESSVSWFSFDCRGLTLCDSRCEEILKADRVQTMSSRCCGSRCGS